MQNGDSVMVAVVVVGDWVCFGLCLTLRRCCVGLRCFCGTWRKTVAEAVSLLVSGAPVCLVNPLRDGTTMRCAPRLGQHL